MGIGMRFSTRTQTQTIQIRSSRRALACWFCRSVRRLEQNLALSFTPRRNNFCPLLAIALRLRSCCRLYAVSLSKSRRKFKLFFETGH